MENLDFFLEQFHLSNTKKYLQKRHLYRHNCPENGKVNHSTRFHSKQKRINWNNRRRKKKETLQQSRTILFR